MTWLGCDNRSSPVSWDPSIVMPGSRVEIFQVIMLSGWPGESTKRETRQRVTHCSCALLPLLMWSGPYRDLYFHAVCTWKLWSLPPSWFTYERMPLKPRPNVSVFIWKHNFFFTDTASVHTYPMKTINENGTFRKRSPEWNFLKTLFSRVRETDENRTLRKSWGHTITSSPLRAILETYSDGGRALSFVKPMPSRLSGMRQMQTADWQVNEKNLVKCLNRIPIPKV